MFGHAVIDEWQGLFGMIDIMWYAWMYASVCVCVCVCVCELEYNIEYAFNKVKT